MTTQRTFSPNGRARLKVDDYPRIRELRAKGHKINAIAAQFRCSPSMVSCIANGKRTAKGRGALRRHIIRDADIIARWNAGETSQEIAARYQISAGRVNNICAAARSGNSILDNN